MWHVPRENTRFSSQARLGRNSLKLAKMSTSETINSGKEKLDNWLHEKNYFTDALDKVEKKTGVKRIYIFLGNFIKYATQFEWTFGSNYKLGVLVSSSFRTHWNIRSLSCVRLWSRSDCDNTGFCLSCLSIVSIFQIARISCLLMLKHLFAYRRHYACILNFVKKPAGLPRHPSPFTISEALAIVESNQFKLYMFSCCVLLGWKLSKA